MSLCPALHEAAVKVASSDHLTYSFNSLMDHLPYPEDAVYPRIQVPYLATEAVAVYHGDNFVDFPVQAGWGEGDADWFDCEPSLAAARAQAWLFFGLLREVVGPAFSETSFIARDGEHNDFVSTKTRLPLLLRKRFRAKEPLLRMMYEGPCHFILLLIITLGTILFIAELRHRISGAAKKLRWKYRIAMIKAEDEVRSIEAAFPDCDDVHLVCLSIRALLWSLRNAVASRDFTIVKRSSLELSSSPYLKRLLIERGMCPHHLATIDERSSVVTLHYLTGLHRPIGPHRDCPSQFCSANILDPSKYKTKHVDDDCDCNFIEPDTAEIRRAIDVGDVPVVRASLRENTIHIDTQRAAFDVPYVAISHVWSGGLGNQWTSSLPICQLRRIYHLLRPLTRPPIRVRRSKWCEIFKAGRSRSEKDVEQCADVFSATESCVFWMDTLCLPKQRPQRDLAIGQMTRVYAGAQQVVVFDKGLQKMGVEIQEEEILANLVSSAWMSRCWTFQEGRMAQKLLINVAGSLRDPFVIYHQVAKQAAEFGPGKETWSDTFQFRRELASGLYRMRPFKDERIRSRDFGDFIDVWNELVSRTTSWPEDEIKILSLMLDLSVNEIESIPGDDMRLKAVFRSQGDLPISFLFIQTASSCGSNDELWVPTNLTAAVDLRPGSMRKTMDVGTGEPGFILDMASDRSVIMRSTLKLSGHFLDVWIGEDGTERQDYTITLTFPEATSNKSRVNTSLGDLYLLHKPGVPTRGLFGCSGRGCRFKIIKEDSTYMVVAYDCSFSYASKLVAETRDAIESVGATSQQMERVVGRIDIRLRCDWRQWPSLQYHRSRTARRMTTTHKPTHPYAFWLFQWEQLLGSGGIIIVLATFPSKPGNGVEPSATDWAAYAICLTVLSCRLLYVLFKEIPTLNRLLKFTEYQRWTESFAQPAANVDGNSPTSPPITAHQYRPWWVTVGFTALGIGLLATGVIVKGANLLEITLAGGYLIGVNSPIVFIETFWRYSSMQTSKQQLLDRLFGKYPIGYDSYNVLKLFSLTEPRSITHGQRNLDVAFGDPLYLPEGYEW